MDHDFWLERWQTSQITFHQPKPEQRLIKYWPGLDLARGSSVFVPLCGKSLDMVWLAGQGHQVIGIELSPLAIRDFFASQKLTPETRTEAGFTIMSAGAYVLWCGDYFAMPEHATQDIVAIYDRAALIALPPEMRRDYARRLIEVGGRARCKQVQTLLLAFEYDQSMVAGPPHSVPRAEVRELFGGAWSITELEHGLTPALSPKFKGSGIDRVAETVYRMAPAAVPQ